MAIFEQGALRYPEQPITYKPRHMELDNKRVEIGQYGKGTDFDGTSYFTGTSAFTNEIWTCLKETTMIHWLELVALTYRRA